jgi:MFS family permease
MAPPGLVMMAVSPLAARLIKARGPRATLMLGAAVVGIGYLLTMAMMSGIWQLIAASCIVAAGVGIAFGALPTLIMGEVPAFATGSANSFNALVRSIGTAVSSAVAGVILAQVTLDFHGTALPSEEGLRAVLAIGAGAAVVALAFASLLPRDTSAPRNAPALTATPAAGAE